MNIIGIATDSDRKYVLSNLKSLLSWQSGFCQLPNNRLFIYASYQGNPNDAFIISIPDRIIVKECNGHGTGKSSIGECVHYNDLFTDLAAGTCQATHASLKNTT
jgi:hypothetical protein